MAESYDTENQKFSNVNTSIGASIAQCFREKELGFSMNQAIKAKNMQNFQLNNGKNTQLRSPRVLQGKLMNTLASKDPRRRNKYSEYKNSTEGSCVDDNKKRVHSSIMDNYLSTGPINNTNSFHTGRNKVTMPSTKNGNHTVVGFQYSTMSSKRSNKGFNQLGVSLVGSMLMELNENHQQQSSLSNYYK